MRRAQCRCLMDSILAEKDGERFCNRQGRIVLCLSVCWKDRYMQQTCIFANAWQTATATLGRVSNSCMEATKKHDGYIHKLPVWQ